MRSLSVLPFIMLMAGCSAGVGQQEIDAARTQYEQLLQSPEVAERAPKDVTRAAESLARAERLADFWGHDKDVAHYAYLSRRYSEIAQEHHLLAGNQQELEGLARHKARLEQLNKELRLLNAQQQGSWLEEQLSSLAAIETERGLVMTMGDVSFDTGSSELNVSAHRTLLQLAQFLQLNPRRRVRIEGYSDSQGDSARNKVLSELRAQSVAQALQDLGVVSERMHVVGYGEAYPVAENATARGRAANRRVEIVFSDEAGQLAAER